MSSLIYLDKSSSSPTDISRKDLEDRAPKQMALKVSQTSETVICKRGREEEPSFQKRRRLNEPSECQITPLKRSAENAKAEIDWDSLPDIEPFWGSKQTFAKDTNFESNIFAEEAPFDSETLATLEKVFADFEEQSKSSGCASEKLRAFNENTRVENSVYDTPYDMEPLTSPNDSIDEEPPREEVSASSAQKDIVNETPQHIEPLTCPNDSICQKNSAKEVTSSGKAIAPKRKRVDNGNSIRFAEVLRKPIIIHFDNGDRYEGMIVEKILVQQLPNGKKESISSVEEQYEGAFVNGKFHKKVELIYEGKSRFNELQSNLSCGNGSFYLADGTVIEGNIESLSFIGSGKITYPDKSYYVGGFYKNQPIGFGTFFCADGEIYKGTFVNGKLQGRTEVILRDQIRYVGNFINGNPTCEGSLYLPNGTVYESLSWRRDLSFGFGKITYPDKTIFEGAFSTPACRTNDLSK